MKRTLIAVALVAVAVAAFLLLRLRHEPAVATRPNVLLVTIDTLRADHVGAYGSSTGATPHLDALAARGARFETAIAHAPLTAPSHASILTGLLPVRHGIRDNGAFALPASVATLAERFERSGYETAAFVSGFPLDHRFGLARGFRTYDDHLPHGHDPRRAPYVERPADATTDVATRWLGTAKGPWFAWVHYFDPHAPYEPPAAFAARFASTPYDGEIAFVDEQLGRLLAAAAVSPGARTLVVVTADHGEGLGDHDEATHGVFLYDSTLRVPLIVAGPGLTPRVVGDPVARGIDVAPTILDLAGVPGEASSFDGRSLRPALEGRALPDAPTYSESLFASLNLGWAPLHAWRTRDHKLIDAPTPELYRLDADPSETSNRADQERDVVAALERPLRAVLALPAPTAALTRTPESAERLRALGYLGGTAPERPSGRDPKAGRVLLQELEQGLAEARARPEVAVKALSAVLHEEPEMPLARRYRAIAYQISKRYPEALEDLAALQRQVAPNLEDLVLLGETQRLGGSPEAALATFDRAVGLAPEAPEAHLFRARVLRALERPAEASASFETVLRLDPANVEARRGLGEIALMAGDLAQASGLYEAVLAQDAQDVGAMVKLGVVRVRSGRVAEGLQLFQTAVERDPNNAEALLDLAAALAKSGRPDQALSYFERSIGAGGETTPALNGLGFARLETGDARGGLTALQRSLVLDPHQPGVADVVKQLRAGARR